MVISRTAWKLQENQLRLKFTVVITVFHSPGTHIESTTCTVLTCAFEEFNFEHWAVLICNMAKCCNNIMDCSKLIFWISSVHFNHFLFLLRKQLFLDVQIYFDYLKKSSLVSAVKVVRDLPFIKPQVCCPRNFKTCGFFYEIRI